MKKGRDRETQFLSTQEALKYLRSEGVSISRPTLYRVGEEMHWFYRRSPNANLLFSKEKLKAYIEDISSNLK